MDRRTDSRARTYRTGPYISHFPTLHNVIQRSHNLLSGRLPIQPVNLQDINVGTQSPHARIHSVEDMLAWQTHAVDPGAVVNCNGPIMSYQRGFFLLHTEEAFGQDDDVGSRNVELLQRLADNFFRFPIWVDVGLLLGALLATYSGS